MELGTGQVDAALTDASRAHGMALLDEAMATAMSGDLGMLATGLSYCRTISACLDVFDYNRANDWIDAIARLPGHDQHGFPGDCLTHQVAVRIVRGEWAEARLEAEPPSRRPSASI